MGDCHFLEGNLRAKERVAYAKTLLDEVGLGGDRIEMYHIGASDAPLWAESLRVEKHQQNSAEGHHFWRYALCEYIRRGISPYSGIPCSLHVACRDDEVKKENQQIPL